MLYLGLSGRNPRKVRNVLSTMVIVIVLVIVIEIITISLSAARVRVYIWTKRYIIQRQVQVTLAGETTHQ